jgi:excisionase family DNA binding protein
MCAVPLEINNSTNTHQEDQSMTINTNTEILSAATEIIRAEKSMSIWNLLEALEERFPVREDTRTVLNLIEQLWLEAMESLGIGRSTLYELIEKGELKKVNIGRRSFITAASLKAFVDRLAEVAS